MFALFFSLYYSMFYGSWINIGINGIIDEIRPFLNEIGTFLTSIFGDFQVTNFGNSITTTNIIAFVAFVLALITSIGIVVMAVKGVKKAFGIFFGQIR